MILIYKKKNFPAQFFLAIALEYDIAANEQEWDFLLNAQFCQ